MMGNNTPAYSEDFMQTLSSVAGLLAKSQDRFAAEAGNVLAAGIKKEKRLQQSAHKPVRMG